MQAWETVVNGNVELYTESFGESGATPVLLIAGAMAPAVFWNDVFCDTLASRGYRVIRFDNRDIGRSTHFPQSAPGSGIEPPYSIGDMVDDAGAVLARYSSSAAHIIGHSLGGSIAQLFSVKYPQITRSLTAVSSPILARGNLPYRETDPGITEEIWRVFMKNPMHPDYARGAPEFLKVWRFLNGDWELDVDMADAYTRALYRTESIGPAWNHTNIQRGIGDIIGGLEGLNKPILFVHGEKDYLAANPENVKTLANHLPGASVYIVSRGGHTFFNQSLWRILTSVIEEHLAKAESAA